jgi:hypothetical protein
MRGGDEDLILRKMEGGNPEVTVHKPRDLEACWWNLDFDRPLG